MKRIFIVRHGRTKWNLEKRFQGANADSPLLSSSKKDCIYLAGFLDKNVFSKIYSSPIKRAKLTAKITLNYSKRYNIQDLLDEKGFSEIGMGKWEGVTSKEVKNRYPRLFQKLVNHQDDKNFSNFKMESFSHARKRFRKTINMVLDSIGDNENILIFSHGVISHLGIKELTQVNNLEPLKNLSTSILKVTQNKHFIIEGYNDIGYLPYINEKGNKTLI